MSEIEKILAKKTLTKEDETYLENYEPSDNQNALYSFFTPIWLCEVMYDLAKMNGFDQKKGKVLEPAAGTGNFLKVLDQPKNCTAFELDPINFEIAKKRVPEIKHFYNDYFETALLNPPRYTQVLKSKTNPTWLSDYPFDLVIGNPPYGKYKNLYSGFFKTLKIKQLEQFFMYQSLRLLKPGGLMVFITGSSFMRNETTYIPEKKRIGSIAEFVDAYRMPKVFKNTAVPTDILIFRKK